MLEPRLSRPVLPPSILPARYLPWPSADRALLGRGGASEVWRCQDRELGVLVGYGTSLANGCTSGHGVCGLGRLSLRSLAATGVFMAAGIATVFVTHHVLRA